MKLVFDHDNIFYKYNNQFYSTGGLYKKMLERYTSVFEKVIVISRQKRIKQIDSGLTLASTPRVEFIEVPDFKKISKILKRIKAKKIIKNAVKDSDAIISRLPSSIGSIALSFSKKYNIPYLLEMVACPWDALWNHSLKGKIIAPIVFLKTKRDAKHSNYVLYVTNEFLQNRYPTKGYSTNCSNVELDDFDENVLKERINKIDKRKESNKIRIGTTAAVNVKHKGQQYIIEALGELKKRGFTNFEYQLVGPGDQTFLKSIANRNNVSNQVVFLGSKKHEEVFKWLDTIDIYTQPSKQEGLPRALIEAMSRGLPAFGANTAGIPELLDNDYIFKNDKKNIKEICTILLNYTNKSMRLQSYVNFKQSKKYDKKLIDKRREEFLIKFLNNNKN